MKLHSILTAALLSLSALSAGAIELPAITPAGDADACGYVHDGTSGIAGVLVTDGYSFVSTAADGSWQMRTNADADFVYVIIPSGYEIGTMENGIIQYFARIDRTDESFRADFLLNPIGDDTEFSFMVHADPQPHPDRMASFGELREAYMDVATKAKALAAKDGFMPPMLMLGDITHEMGYEEYKGVLRTANFQVPLFPVPGNHDKRYVVNVKESCERYSATFGPRYYSFNRGKVHFLMLDNVFIEEDGDYIQGLTLEQIAWVKKDLEYVAKGSTLVVGGHIAYTRGNTSKKRYKVLLDMLEDYNVLLLSGHYHRSINVGMYSATIEERNQMALCGHIWRGPVGKDGTPKGYYIYYVDGTDISWKFVQTGKDPDKFLFKVYDPSWTEYVETPLEHPSRVLVNVWDWDPHWSVKWSFNGEDRGDVARFESALDPLAVYNYNTLESEALHALESAHMFYIDVPSEGGKVEVTVTDRFGRTLSKSLDVAAGIECLTAESSGVVSTAVYDMQGRKVAEVSGLPETDTLPLGTGCYIMRKQLTDGTSSTEKVMVR